jgi:hypothetical protein
MEIVEEVVVVALVIVFDYLHGFHAFHSSLKSFQNLLLAGFSDLGGGGLKNVIRG